jgi:tetratricopeptide (TPR) repeat protein
MSLIQRTLTIFSLLSIGLFCTFLVTANASTSEDNSAIKEELFETLRSASNETEGRYAEDAIWKFWFNQAPTPQIRSTLDASIKRREAYDFEAAEILLDDVIKQAPDYAEGYNQRAFIRFLRDKQMLAQQDALRALELEPDHFGAISGLFHILSKLNKKDAALVTLQRGVSLHPWMKERFSLPKDMWPDSYRNIHEPGTSI